MMTDINTTTTADNANVTLTSPANDPTEPTQLTGNAADPQYHRRFGSRTTALEVLKDVDLSGKTIMITGCTSGIGYETARALALHGSHLVMANRNIVLSEQVRDKIYQETEKRNIDIINVDLSSLQSVKAAAEEFISKGWPLHSLILNAGVFAPTQKVTIDGYDTSFGVNHLGHFYLTYLLMDKLRESAPSRLVVVSSNFHTKTGIDPAAPTDVQLAKLIPPPNNREFALRLYAYSKLCNILMAFKIHHDEFEKSKIHTYALHPGSFVASDIGRSYGILGKIFNTVTKPLTKTPEQGAATSVYCAASPDCESESGKYYESCWDGEGSLHKALAYNRKLQDALWDKSVALIKEFEGSK